MLSETVFSSDDLPVADRFDGWRERMAVSHAPMDLASDFAADFWARQRLVDLGPVKVWPATFQELVFTRTPALIRRSDPETFHLSLVVRGQGHVSRGKQLETISTRGFLGNDSSRPYEIVTSPGLLASVGLEVPKAVLPLPRRQAERVIGQPMTGREGPGALLAHLLLQVATGSDAYRPADGPRLGAVAADLAATLFARSLENETALPPETRTRTLLLAIKAFIRQHLADADLTPGQIAAAHHISRSYLHRLFQNEDTTVAAYIRRQRLEAARRDLADPAHAATPIHAIAARSGYPCAADFTRAFRAAYGIPPRDYRRGVGQSQEPR